MKLNASITILGNKDGVRIQIHDNDASVNFLEITMTPEAFIQAAFGRLSNCECECEINGLEKLGKKMEWKKLEFEMPEGSEYPKCKIDIAKSEALNHIPSGWSCDGYFNSQDSFFYKYSREWARCMIRRWV